MLEKIIPNNFIISVDSYKYGHWSQMPASAENTYSLIVPRKASDFSPDIVAAGQTFVAEMLARAVITAADVEEAEREVTEMGYEFNREGWDIIINEYAGRLPVVMMGVEEGRVIRPQTPQVAFFLAKPDSRLAWLPSYLETWAQATIWKMSTVATTCRAARLIMKQAMEKTGANMAMLDYKVHNFGDRGADSPDEAPTIAGLAAAMVFRGSDCTRVNRLVRELYGDPSYVAVTSIEATEHSTTCANSDAETKDDYKAVEMAVERLEAAVARSKRGIGLPMISAVIDTYDSRRYVQAYAGGTFRDRILRSGGVFVFRPDSGDPEIEPGLVADDISNTFGYSINEAGYKVLNPATAVIQGDGVRINTMPGIVDAWVRKGYSIDSFTVGMGSGITHEGSRDTFSYSMKAVASFQNGTWKRLLKDPITDSGKRSLSGLVVNRILDGVLTTIDVTQYSNCEEMIRESVPGWRCWYNGTSRVFTQHFEEVRALATA